MALPGEGTDGMKRENEHHTSTSYITARVRACISRRTYVAHMSKASKDARSYSGVHIEAHIYQRRTYIEGRDVESVDGERVGVLRLKLLAHEALRY